MVIGRASGLTRQPATGVHRSVIQAFWVARLKVDPNQLRAFRWSPCRLFLSVVSRPNRKRISVRVSLFHLCGSGSSVVASLAGAAPWCASEMEQ